MIEHVNKPFVVLLIIAVIIGVSIGGVFAGGVAFGKASDVEPATALALGGPRPNSTDGAGQGGQGQFSRASSTLRQPLCHRRRNPVLVALLFSLSREEVDSQAPSKTLKATW